MSRHIALKRRDNECRSLRSLSLPKEDGNKLREYLAMHEENFLSGWLREDVEGRKAKMERLNEEAKQEERNSGKREVERRRKG